MPLFFTLLSLFGVAVGVFMIREGIGGGMGAALTIAIGIFMVFKEIMDIIFAG